MANKKELITEEVLHAALGSHCETCCDLANQLIKLRLEKVNGDKSYMEWYEHFWNVSEILEMPGSPSVDDVLKKLRQVYSEWKRI